MPKNAKTVLFRGSLLKRPLLQTQQKLSNKIRYWSVLKCLEIKDGAYPIQKLIPFQDTVNFLLLVMIHITDFFDVYSF